MTRVLPDRAVCADFGLLLLAWIAAGAFGWLLHRHLADPNAIGAARVGGWLACAAVALGLGMALARPLPGGDSAAVRWAGLVAVGWAVANSAGWFLGVELGGPLTGVVTALALGSCRVLRPGTGDVARVVLVAVVGVGGVVAGWLLVGGGPTGGVGLVAPTVGGLVAVVVARAVLLPKLPLVPIVVLVGALATAWVGAWTLASTLVSPVSLGLSVVVEIVLAMAIGGAAVGLTYRRVTGEAVRGVALRWGIAAGGGFVVGVAVATALRGLLGGELVEHLDVGTTVGLGAAAWFAVLPTLHLLHRSRRDVAP